MFHIQLQRMYVLLLLDGVVCDVIQVLLFLVLFSSCQPSLSVHQAVAIIHYWLLRVLESPGRTVNFPIFPLSSVSFRFHASGALLLDTHLGFLCLLGQLVFYVVILFTSSWQIDLLPLCNVLFYPLQFSLLWSLLGFSIATWAFFWLVLMWWFFSWPFSLCKTSLLYSKQVF